MKRHDWAFLVVPLVIQAGRITQPRRVDPDRISSSTAGLSSGAAAAANRPISRARSARRL
ncbi:hypothetical protein AIOL_003340 [Candidatus Rhodobacter oscarellae]|uniref:Uncharacterized protein n=1 Tax=Candidatus Rhodobacter oscarellae TaxID=1675527 RepID=A0A0J9E6P9_9RHOB|nr:hypothetical protein AIOL_003340 [Candidatus Rhodobacter lobularis]